MSDYTFWQRYLPASAHKALALTLSLATVQAASCAIAAEGPFRLNEQLGLNEGFSLALTHRSRFENIVDNVRPGTSKNDQVLGMRTLLDMNYRSGRFMGQLELADMRQQLMDADSVINNTVVNSLDILQATAGITLDSAGDSTLRFGRFTEDWGSRRMMARNRFRNTINSWDGAVLHTRLDSGAELKAMATQVVSRLPTDRQQLLDNKRQSDRSYDAQRFYGVHLSLPSLFADLPAEFYYFALREKDTADLQTRNRRLNTAGFRLRALPASGEFDFEIETIVQNGSQRASSSPLDRTDLDHRAWFQFLALGYSFNSPLNPRLSFEFDYASGDEEPFDADSGRFDSLFGPTAFEFGVVGLYNPFNRSNLVSPALRLTADLSPTIDVQALYRHFWLAQAKDSWGRTGIRDITGNSGDYLGQHLELRLRWDIVPGNLRLESGAIFLQSADLSDKDSEYVYAGVTLTL